MLLSLGELISFGAYIQRVNFIYQLKQRNIFLTVGDDEDMSPLIRYNSFFTPLHSSIPLFSSSLFPPLFLSPPSLPSSSPPLFPLSLSLPSLPPSSPLFPLLPLSPLSPLFTESGTLTNAQKKATPALPAPSVLWRPIRRSPASWQSQRTRT